MAIEPKKVPRISFGETVPIQSVEQDLGCAGSEFTEPLHRSGPSTRWAAASLLTIPTARHLLDGTVEASWREAQIDQPQRSGSQTRPKAFRDLSSQLEILDRGVTFRPEQRQLPEHRALWQQDSCRDPITPTFVLPAVRVVPQGRPASRL
ncbi:MAG: hypothetical protein WEB03_12540 [Nitriliruptor sp.]